MREVVVDTDYFNFITLNCTDKDLFLVVMNEMQFFPVLHEYVYEEELHECSFVKNLVKDGNIKIIRYTDFLLNEKKMKEYKRLAEYGYEMMNGETFDNTKDIVCYHHEKENLGEIHSITLARMLKLDCFMSNDGGARSYVENHLNNNKSQIITIYNIEDTFNYIHKNIQTSLNWGRIKNVIKQYKNSGLKANLERYERIRNVWKCPQ